MKDLRKVLFVFVAAMILLSPFLGVTPSICKEKPIELTYSCPYTLNVSYAKAARNWLKYIEKESEGRIRIRPYWGGTLISGREVLAELARGVADIALGSAFTKKGYEITWAMGAFVLGSPSPEVTGRVSREIFEKFPEYQQEFPELLVLGYRNCFDNILQTKKDIKSLDDLKGLIINTGTPGDVIFPRFGARTVKVPPPEWYTSLQKGTFDGNLLQPETLKGFRLAEVVDYVNLDIKIPCPGIPMTFMNLRKFRSLPKDLQKIIYGSREYLYNEQMRTWGHAQQEGIDFAKQQGVKFNHLPNREIDKWRTELQKLGLETAKKVDAAGKSGTEILNETVRLIKQYSE